MRNFSISYMVGTTKAFEKGFPDGTRIQRLNTFAGCVQFHSGFEHGEKGWTMPKKPTRKPPAKAVAKAAPAELAAKN